MTTITTITPVWENTNLEWLEERNTALREVGDVTFGYVGPPDVLAKINALHLPGDDMLFKQTEMVSVAAKRNMLLRYVTTPYIIMADDDDLFDAQVLRAHRVTLDRNPGLAASLGSAVDVDENNEPLPSPETPEGDFTGRDVRSYWLKSRAEHGHHGVLPFLMQAGVWRTSVVKQAGGWWEKVNDGMYGEDMPLGVVAANIKPVRVTNLTTVRYRRHPGSLSHRGWDFSAELQLITAMSEAAMGWRPPKITNGPKELYEISKDFHFSASHQLEGLPADHPCSRLHGHNFIVRLYLASEELTDVGFVVDYRSLQHFSDWLDETFDHRHLNDAVTFNPTSENMTRYIYDTAKDDFHLPVSAVSWSETPKTWATYRREQ